MGQLIIYDFPQEMYNDAWYFFEEGVICKDRFFTEQRNFRMSIICIHSCLIKFLDRCFATNLPIKFTYIKNSKNKKINLKDKKDVNWTNFPEKIKVLKFLFTGVNTTLISNVEKLNEMRNKIVHYDDSEIIYKKSTGFFPDEHLVKDYILSVHELIKHIWVDLEKNDVTKLGKIYLQKKFKSLD